jgi:hypothetical protein
MRCSRAIKKQAAMVTLSLILLQPNLSRLHSTRLSIKPLQTLNLWLQIHLQHQVLEIMRERNQHLQSTRVISSSILCPSPSQKTSLSCTLSLVAALTRAHPAL